MKLKSFQKIRKLSTLLKIEVQDMKTQKQIITAFPNYFICRKTCRVFNFSTNKPLKPSKRKGSNEKFYKLYRDGVSTTLSLWQILILIFDRKYTKV